MQIDYRALSPLLQIQLKTKAFILHNSHLVGLLKGLEVGSEAHKSLLETIGTNQGIDLLDLERVTILDSLLDLVLVGARVHDEHDGVVVLNLVHGALSLQRVLDQVELVLGRRLGTKSERGRKLGILSLAKSAGAVKVQRRAHASLTLLVLALTEAT